MSDELMDRIREVGPDKLAIEDSRLFSDSAVRLASNREWYNWLNVVDKLRARGIEINDDDDLTDALQGWGDAMQNLSMVQR